jgi:OPT oligopeptide transporter protein
MFPLNQPSFTPFRLILLPLAYPILVKPRPWNIKEHVLVYIMANVAIGNPYALNAIVVSKVYYGIVFGYWFSLTLVLVVSKIFGLAC